MSDKEKSRKTAALKAMGALRTAKKNVLRAIWDGKDLQDVTDCLTAARARGVESWSQEDTSDLRTTPLIEAAKSRTGDNVEMTRLLAGWCDASALDENGDAALGWCVAKEKTQSAIFLVERAAADVNQLGREGFAPIHVAAGKGNLELVKFLAQFSPLPLTENNETALHLATEHRNAECARFLLDHCDPGAQNALSQTALDIAIENDCAEIAAFLAPVSGLGDRHDNQFAPEMHALLAASAGSVNCVSLFLPQMWTSRDLKGGNALDLILEGSANHRRTTACLAVLERDAPLDIGREALAKHGEDALPVLFARVEADDLMRAIEPASIGAPVRQEEAAEKSQETARKEKTNKKRL